jgi:hypothetical protein
LTNISRETAKINPIIFEKYGVPENNYVASNIAPAGA